jgi:hypothetical protein
MDVRHLRRETRTALELAVVTLAPSELIDRLALSTGLMEAVIELPANSPPVAALLPRLLNRTREALEDWGKWHAEHLAQKIPRG